MDTGIILLIAVFSILFSLPFLCKIKGQCADIDWAVIRDTRLGKMILSIWEEAKQTIRTYIDSFKAKEEEIV